MIKSPSRRTDSRASSRRTDYNIDRLDGYSVFRVSLVEKALGTILILREIDGAMISTVSYNILSMI